MLAEQFANVKEGIYFDVPASIYHSWPGLSHSRSKKFQQSPAHVLHALYEPPETTKSQMVGTVIHAAILEPDRFKKEYQIIGQCQAFTKAGAQCSNNAIGYNDSNIQACGVHKGIASEFLVDKDTYAAATNLADKCRQHKLIEPAMRAGAPEVSLFWYEPEFGIYCKARMDWLNQELQAVIDIKSCTDARNDFPRQAISNGYFRQQAFYERGLDRMAELGLIKKDFGVLYSFCFVAAEIAPPYGIMCHFFNDADMCIIRNQIMDVMKAWASCNNRGDWPEYSQEHHFISIPQWEKERNLIS